MATLAYKIITPERTVMEGEALSLSVMTEMGEITVLPNHIPLAALLQAGEMRVKTPDGQEELLAVSSGLLQVKAFNQIVILAQSAERSQELELEQIKLAKQRAEDALKNIRNREDVSFFAAAAQLERELARYRVALKRKR
jgi:F-type H+-transporting ATPase subunit epsilon